MLVLSRKKGQSIMIGHDIEISIIDVQGEQIRLGINAPRSVTIHRKEVFEEIIQENKQAASTAISPDIIRTMRIEKKEGEE
ncbi:MAG: carbon storage regulator CsrA [Clostridiaceae bacterium]|nr:carbon storage regulator CsrA [Clostridiaceae bacterium]